MAVAGKVAITPKGNWSSGISYQKLDLVYYNNASYVSIQPSTGVVPTNTTYWMLVLQSASEADLEAIISGATKVGNAKTLNGLTDEAFVKRASNTSITLYVDNVNGLDTNTGTSKDKPLKTMNSNFQTRFSNYSSVSINLLSDYVGDMSLPRHNQTTLQSDDASNPVTVYGAISAYGIPYFTIQNINVECSGSAIKFDTSSGLVKSVKVLQSESGVVVTQGNVRLQTCEINATTRALWAYSVGVVTVMNDVKYTSGNIGVSAQNGSVVSMAQAVINNSTATKHFDFSSGASAGAIFVNGKLQNPVTDAGTLDGLDSTAFVKTEGGMISNANNVPFGIKNTVEDTVFMKYVGKTGDLGNIGFASKDLPVYRTTDGTTQYALLHTGNASEYLADTESGTFTLKMQGVTLGTGTYYRVGKMIHCKAMGQIPQAFEKGYLSLTGFPFAITSKNGSIASFHTHNFYGGKDNVIHDITESTVTVNSDALSASQPFVFRALYITE